MNFKILAAAASLALAASAQAATTTIDFNNGTAPGFSGEFAVFQSSVPSVATSIDATPFLAIPGPSVTTGTATYTSSNFITSLSFDWGSPDSYNTVTFKGADGVVASYSGATAVQGRVTYNFAASDKITSIDFSSSNRAFEIDNVSVAAVPEPATWGLMLAGFGMVGFAARRRASGSVTA